MAMASRGVAAAMAVWENWGARSGMRVCPSAASSAAALSFDSGLHSGSRDCNAARGSFNEGSASTSGRHGTRICNRGTHQLPLHGPNSSLLPRTAFSTDGVVDNQVSLHYTRHGTEFLLGIRGSKQDLERVKSRLTTFLTTELHLDVTQAPHTHIQAGKVLFLGTQVSGLLDNKARRRFSKEIEKRRRSKARAQGEARIRTEAWHNELKDVAVQAWSFGLKKVNKDLESWSTANQVLAKKSQQVTKFEPDQIDGNLTREAMQRLLDKEEEIFMDASGFPHQILRAQQRLTRLLKKHLEEEKKVVSRRETRPQKSTPREDDGSIPIRILAPMEVIMEKLSAKGILQPSKALPTVVPHMLDSSDEAIISYFAALGGCLLSYYRCCDNFEKVRRLVDHQVRWSALFTLGSKHGCSARKIMRRFSRGPRVVDAEDGSVVVEFPSSVAIARTGKKFLGRAEVPALEDVLRARPVQLRPGREG